MSMFYRLLPSLHAKQPISETDKLWHLGLMAFLATLLMEFNRQSSDYEHLSEGLRDAIHSFSDTGPQSKQLLMWCIFIGGVSVLDVGGQERLKALLTETCDDCQIHNWTDVRAALCSFPWIGILHDAPGEMVWGMVQSNRGIVKNSDCAVIIP